MCPHVYGTGGYWIGHWADYYHFIPVCPGIPYHFDQEKVFNLSIWHKIDIHFLISRNRMEITSVYKAKSVSKGTDIVDNMNSQIISKIFWQSNISVELIIGIIDELITGFILLLHS